MDKPSDPWIVLTRGINRILAASRDNHIRFTWLDRIVPESEQLEPDQHIALATALVTEDSGKSFVDYRLTLFLSRSAADAYRNGEFDKIHPDQNATAEFKIDRTTKEIELNCDA